MDDMNTTYQDLITSFVLNIFLHHVGMLWIIDINIHLEYDMDKHNSDWMTGGPWYNTSICKKYMETCLKNSLEMQELTDIISCVLLMHMKKIIRHHVIMEAAVVVIYYHQIQQHRHFFQCNHPFHWSLDASPRTQFSIIM